MDADTVISGSSSLLTASDIQALLNNHSVDARAETIRKVTTMYAKTEFVENEKRIAEDIFRLVARDVEESIRVTLSWNLSTSEHLPPDIAKTLAKDVSDTVANSILQFSTQLSSEDLIEIIKEGNENRQSAIASRMTVNERVSSALAEHGGEKAVQTLLKNNGAIINEASFHKIVDRFEESETIHEGIVMRNQIPESIAERMVDKISEELQKTLIFKHHLDRDKAKQALKFSLEKATIAAVSPKSKEHATSAIYNLHSKGRLSPTIILRSLCAGETVFFENAVSFLTKIPVPNIRKLLYDKGGAGFQALYERANLPPRLFPAARVAVDLIREINYLGGDPDVQESFARMVVGRLMRMLGKEDEDVTIDTLLASLEDDE